jgi:tetratricopeptide (TPR) repeat protein
VEKLRKAQPQSPAAAELQSRLAVLDNKPDQAVEILHELIRVDPPQLAACAALLEDLRLYPAAEELFRRFAAEPGRPANVLTLAEYLGRRGRIREALDLCDKAWTNLPAGQPAYTGIQVLFSSNVEPADCARVAARLETAIKAAPDDIALTFYLANVRILQGRYADAETIFLAAFERNKSSSTPLNNLAWLLSLQDGKTARALETVNQAISIGGAVPEYLDTRGVIYLAMGRSDLAIKELEDAVAVAPTPDNHFHLAQAYFAAKREIDAVDALHEAQNLGLKPETLHPFERKAYQRLINRLPKKG